MLAGAQPRKRIQVERLQNGSSFLCRCHPSPSHFRPLEPSNSSSFLFSLNAVSQITLVEQIRRRHPTASQALPRSSSAATSPNSSSPQTLSSCQSRHKQKSQRSSLLNGRQNRTRSAPCTMSAPRPQKLEHARLYPNYRVNPMKRVDKDRMREEKRQAKEQERAGRRTTRGRASPYPLPPTRQQLRHGLHRLRTSPSRTPKLPLHPSHPRTRCRLPVPISRCTMGRLMHQMTRVRVRSGQTQPTHTVHRRVHRPILGPITLSQPRFPLSPRACSSPRLRVSLTGAGSPRNRMHQQPSSTLSKNSCSRTGRSLLFGRTKRRNHSRHVAISPIDKSFSLSRV